MKWITLALAGIVLASSPPAGAFYYSGCARTLNGCRICWSGYVQSVRCRNGDWSRTRIRRR
jgi:hypothetical protein